MFRYAAVRLSQRVVPRLAPRLSRTPTRAKGLLAGIAVGTVVSGVTFVSCATAKSRTREPPFDIAALRSDVEDLISDKLELGPALVRLAWHEAASYDSTKKDGSPNSASMRFKPECMYAGNNGLDIPRAALEPLKKKYPQISYADLWVLASYVAIEYMGGPAIPYSWGRVDAKDGAACGPDGRLPDGAQTQKHVRSVFTRLGFNDQETVALIGAHTCGECHLKYSGFEGPWTHDKNGFDNSFFTELLDEDWVVNGKIQQMQMMDRATTRLMMLPSDMCLILDPKYRTYVELYAKDNDRFNSDFSKAFKKLTELGTSNLHPAPAAES
ncbi:ascorbate peroxidase [Novymonas esmeraldas]|uniref:Cytochrome c peroxidase, mitochondrial n=1 Tax=Novymonas esmeraldas TaxID=1808958 RepID=A0AAW0ESZ4_9TRYP